jgi:hypothetical protein
MKGRSLVEGGKLSKFRKRLSMATRYRRIFATTAVFALLLAGTEDGRAQVAPHAALDAPGSNAKSDLLIAGFLTAVVLVGVGSYFAIRRQHALKGCVVDGSKGMELQTESGQTFALFGRTDGVRAGERVKVSGSRQKAARVVSARQSFIVQRLDRDFGACTVARAHT